MKELEINITHIKLLATISSLNRKKLYPISDGIYKIVAGIIDNETAAYVDEPAFGTLISFTSKKVCRYLLALQRHKYIKKIYAPKKDCLVYATTELGETTLNKYMNRRKREFIKKERNIKETIIKI
jgi:hypothetical protein